MSQELRLKNINKAGSYFRKEIEQNELKTKKQRKLCTTLNYIEHLF